MEETNKLYEDYSKKCIEQLTRLVNLVKTMLKFQHKKTNELENILNSLLSNTVESYGLDDLYLKFIKPLFDYLTKMLLPTHEYVEPNQAFVLMKITLVIIVKHLNTIEKSCCNEILEFRKRLQNYYKEMECDELDKCILTINPKIKLNSVLKSVGPQLPMQLLKLYTSFFKNMLDSGSFVNGLQYMNKLDKSLKRV